MRAALLAGAGIVLSVLLGACSVVYPRVKLDEAVPLEIPASVEVAPTNGSLFHAASYRPLFEEHRARTVGDTLTVSIVEKVSATTKSNSSVEKKGSLDASVKALPGVSASSFTGGRAAATASNSNTFDGKGSTESSNDFSGTITVVVRGVLPNGHLLISGEKQIGVNHNIDILRFSGQVDPRSIQPGNSIQSTQVANVRLEQRGRGQAAEAQAMGWLSRAFMSILPF